MLKIVNLCITNKEKNKFLLIHRIKPPYLGYWGMLGGKVEKDEEINVAAKRELKEESGLIKEGEFLGKCHERVFEKDNTVYEFDIYFYCFVVDETNIDLSFDSKEGELRWFKLEEFKVEKIIPSDPLMIDLFLNKKVQTAESIVEKKGEEYSQIRFENLDEKQKEKNLKIGIDIDGVVADFSRKFIEFYNRKTGNQVSMKDWVTYNFWDFLPISKEEGKALMDEFYLLSDFDEISLIEGAKEGIFWLSKESEIYIITARPLKWAEKTKSFFDKHFFGKKINLIHSRDNKDKTIYKREICRNLGISILIEDYGDIALQCADIGVKVILLDYPYNQGARHKNIFRVNNWEEVLEEIEEIKKLPEKTERKLKLVDSVYGVEEINEPVLIDLINSASVQRLKGISQYGMPDEYYHKKNYSRYDHSIGVFLLLRRLGADLKEQIAGLLHDVSHTAFSHVVDWVLGDSTKEDYQDNNHLNFIRNSEIPKILEKYCLNFEEISDSENFSLLEQPAPGLCADRIDYALRELKKEGKSIDLFVLNLINFKGQIAFKSKEAAEGFAYEYLGLQNEHWASNEARARYFVLASILKKGLEKNIISLEDLYKTDMEIINKLILSSDLFILENLNLLKNKLIIKEVKTPEGILLKKKFRYIDPEVRINEETRKLSEVSEEYKQRLEKEKQNSIIERRIIILR
ncbi:MAG: NUDIX domain-containing protein [Candidatus Pacearchaeota archaeon]|jgi:hypothetical protein